jgi:hypothetical protein
MRLSEVTRRPLMTAGAVIGVLAIAGATVAWRAAGASAAPARPATAIDQAPATTSTTTAPTTSTTVKPTTTTSTSTTSTTVKPRPVTTAAPTTRPPTTSPPQTAARVIAPAPVAQPTNDSPEARCASAHQWVVGQGLPLPAGWGFRCPGSAVVAGAERWGVACWNCEGTGSSWIAVDVGRIGASTAALRYVIAHETCHAIDYTTLGITTEIGADLCAALHGAPHP